MISGINLGATVDYVCKDDKENPTTWKLGMIPNTILTEIATLKQTEAAFIALRLGLKGWNNFEGREYKTVKESIFGKEMDILSVELMNSIPLTVVKELVEKIIEINKLSSDEIKN